MTVPVRAVALGAQGPLSPAFRIRTAVPAPALARHGVELVSLPLFDARGDARFRSGGAAAKAAEVLRAHRSLHRRLAALPQDVGVAMIQRQADMLPLLRLEQLACSGRRVVLDVDDAVWIDTSPGAHAHPLAVLKGTRRKLRWLAHRADHVIAGNERIAEWFAQLTSQVSVVPSLIDPSGVAVRAHAPAEAVVLGWIGSPSTAPHLHALAPQLERLARSGRNPRFELVVVGGPAPRVDGMPVRELAWSPSVERETLARMDVGLMPLPDDEWTRSKCAYKALLYMAAGIPVVADAVGVSAEVIGQERAGLLPAERAAWPEALLTLGGDADLRRRLGAEGRRRIEAGYSIDRWVPELARILRG